MVSKNNKPRPPKTPKKIIDEIRRHVKSKYKDRPPDEACITSIGNMPDEPLCQLWAIAGFGLSEYRGVVQNQVLNSVSDSKGEVDDTPLRILDSFISDMCALLACTAISVRDAMQEAADAAGKENLLGDPDEWKNA